MSVLSERQKAFIHFMMTTGNPQTAFIEAGYSPNNAKCGPYRMLANPKIRAELDKRQTRRDKELEIEEDYELRRAVDILDKCMTPEPVKDGFGKPIKNEEGKIIYQFDSRGANAALITICRLRGKFKDKAVVDVNLTDRAARLNKLLLKFDLTHPDEEDGDDDPRNAQD